MSLASLRYLLLCCYYLRLYSSHSCDFFFFFFNDTATTEIYTLSLHDALPICYRVQRRGGGADFLFGVPSGGRRAERSTGLGGVPSVAAAGQGQVSADPGARARF